MPVKPDKMKDSIKEENVRERFDFQFWLLCASSFLFFSSFNMMIPELPNYLTQLGGAEYKGFIISLFTLTAGFSRPFSGKLADTIGRIPVMVIGASVCFVIGFVYPMITTVAGFFLLRLFHGFSTGFKPTGTSAYVADVVPFNRRGEAMGILGVFGSVGGGVGYAVSSFIVNNFTLNALFYTSSFVAIFSIIILLGMKETLPDAQRFQWHQLYIHRHEILEPRVKAPSIILLLTTFSYGIVLTIIPDFSVYLGMSNKGLFLASFIAASMLVRVIAGRMSDKYGRVKILRYSILLLMVSMILVGASHNIIFFLVNGAILGASVGMNTPTLFAWTIDLSDPLHRGRAVATMYIALEVGIGLGAVVSGFMFNNVMERIPLTFYTGALLAGIAFLYLEFVYLRKQAAHEQSKN